MIASGTDDPVRNELPRFLAIDYLRFAEESQVEWFVGVAALDTRIWAIGVTRSTVFCLPIHLRIPANYLADGSMPADLACHGDRLVLSMRRPNYGAWLGECSFATGRWGPLTEVAMGRAGDASLIDKAAVAIDFDRTTGRLYAMIRWCLSELRADLSVVRNYDFGVPRWSGGQRVNPHIGSDIDAAVWSPYPALFGPSRTSVGIGPLVERPASSFPNTRCEFAVENGTILFFNYTDPELTADPMPQRHSLWMFDLSNRCASLLAYVNAPSRLRDGRPRVDFESLVHLSLEPWSPWLRALRNGRSQLRLPDLWMASSFSAIPVYVDTNPRDQFGMIGAMAQ